MKSARSRANKAKRRRVRLWGRIKRRTWRVDPYWTLDSTVRLWLEGRLDLILSRVYRSRLPPRTP
jgi:hypothetical protein